MNRKQGEKGFEKLLKAITVLVKRNSTLLLTFGINIPLSPNLSTNSFYTSGKTDAFLKYSE